ncbi:MAG TPA: DUF3035 domain-containing protein [Alphaproteobacteria bacterium]|nr:DUF3035 domain-containing protein [Alphaproteobacteria bacterium]
MHRKTLTTLAALAALLALGACSTFKALTEPGDAPTNQDSIYADSVRRPPLTLPPDFNLRPPATSGVGATDITAAQQARQSVFGLDQQKAGANVQRKAGLSLGESALLQHAGATDVSPNIRSQVDRQTQNLDAANKDFTENLLNSNGQSQVGTTTPQKPQGWLQSIFNSNTDQKPTIQRTSGGIFGDLF